MVQEQLDWDSLRYTMKVLNKLCRPSTYIKEYTTHIFPSHQPPILKRSDFKCQGFDTNDQETFKGKAIFPILLTLLSSNPSKIMHKPLCTSKMRGVHNNQTVFLQSYELPLLYPNVKTIHYLLDFSLVNFLL